MPIKLLDFKDKDKIFKTSGQKEQILFSKHFFAKLIMSREFGIKTNIQRRQQWSTIFFKFKERNCEQRISYTVKLSFKYQISVYKNLWNSVSIDCS